MQEIDKHMKGFEKEARLCKMWAHPEVSRRLYMFEDFMVVARVINPELCEGAFERRPCRRRLRYIEFGNWDEPTRLEMRAERTNEGYVYGDIYHSIDFNGATYTIEGTGDIIGSAYF